MFQNDTVNFRTVLGLCQVALFGNWKVAGLDMRRRLPELFILKNYRVKKYFITDISKNILTRIYPHGKLSPAC